MSIREQVKELREMSWTYCGLDVQNALLKATDTIEYLSAKLQAANMELIEKIDREIDGVIVKDTYSKGKNAGLRKAKFLVKEQLGSDCGGGWIPCKERLPEENQNVIACFAHGTVTELQFYDNKFHGIYDYDEKVIIAWQPLPEPYHEP